MLADLAAMVLSAAATGGERYGDTLLARELRVHPDLRYARIDLDAPSAAPFESGSTPSARRMIAVPLANGVGARIGSVTLGFTSSSRNSEAPQIARNLARHAYTAAVLVAPDPFVAGAFRSRLAQGLVERELREEPCLVTIAFHVAIPGRGNEIIASNFGRIGKAADKDDQHVIADSAVLNEETNGGRRVAVELPLLDSGGRTIGALSTSFMAGPGGRQGAYRSALRVQHQLSRSIPRLESLAR